MSHRIAPEAEADLDEIWYFVAVQSGNFEIADRVVDSLLDRFLLISRYTEMGRRDHDPALRVAQFPGWRVCDSLSNRRIERDNLASYERKS